MHNLMEPWGDVKFPPGTSFGAWGNELCIEANGPCSGAKPHCFPGARGSGNNPEVKALHYQILYCKFFYHKRSLSWACWCLSLPSSLCFPLPLLVYSRCQPQGGAAAASPWRASRAGLHVLPPGTFGRNTYVTISLFLLFQPEQCTENTPGAECDWAGEPCCVSSPGSPAHIK